MEDFDLDAAVDELLAHCGNDNAPIGSKATGYSGPELGPFLCLNCVHSNREGIRCNHPDVVADPEVEKDDGLAIIEPAACCNEFHPRHPDMKAYGTSEGVTKAWDTRGRGRKEQEVDQKKLNGVLADWQETSNDVAEKASTAIRRGHAESNEIVHQIRNEIVKGPIYRGLFVDDDAEVADQPEGTNLRFADLKAGDELQLMPTSFSTEKYVAERFATGAEQGLDGTKGMSGILLEVSDDMVNGIDVNHHLGMETGEGGDEDVYLNEHADEYEVISGGKYEVVERSVDGKNTYIRLKQKGVF